MGREIQPIGSGDVRLPEQGRIRMGIKKGRAMTAIDTWRLTGARRDIERAAELYGGQAKPWADATVMGEWEVITDADRLPIVLPPDPLSISYELWSKGGLQRRCDGVTCARPVSTPDGWENAEGACICIEKGELACDLHVRLRVILPELPFAGVWRLDTKSWNAYHELPGMVAALQNLTGAGVLVRAKLVNTAGTPVVRPKAGGGVQTQQYRVPRIEWEESFNEIVAGAGQVKALAAAGMRAAALEAGPPVEADDRVVPAEIVVDEEMALSAVDRLVQTQHLTATAHQLFDALATRYDELDGEELFARIITTCERIESGELVLVDIDNKGVAVVEKAA